MDGFTRKITVLWNGFMGISPAINGFLEISSTINGWTSGRFLQEFPWVSSTQMQGFPSSWETESFPSKVMGGPPSPRMSWLTGKSFINGGFNGDIIYKW